MSGPLSVIRPVTASHSRRPPRLSVPEAEHVPVSAATAAFASMADRSTSSLGVALCLPSPNVAAAGSNTSMAVASVTLFPLPRHVAARDHHPPVGQPGREMSVSVNVHRSSRDEHAIATRRYRLNRSPSPRIENLRSPVREQHSAVGQPHRDGAVGPAADAPAWNVAGRRIEQLRAQRVAEPFVPPAIRTCPSRSSVADAGSRRRRGPEAPTSSRSRGHTAPARASASNAVSPTIRTRPSGSSVAVCCHARQTSRSRQRTGPL